MNLLKETKRILDDYDKSMDDVLWIGRSDYEIPKEEFIVLADKEYNNGYGAQIVAADLIVCGEDFWLERAEYDGAEWWEFKQYPIRPGVIKKGAKIIL